MAATLSIQVALATVFAVGLVSGSENWKHELLDKENHYRSIHDSDPLHYNEELADRAQEWAEHLGVECNIQSYPHAPASNPGLWYQGMPSGENINRGTETGMDLQSWSEKSAVGSADAWYSEEKKYPYGDYDGTKPVKGTNHFTQMVWRDTKEVGYGLATCNDNTFILVARYSPMGNVAIVGQNNFKANVLPPQH